MLKNALIVDVRRVKLSVMEDFGRRFVWMMDFIAVDNNDGTYNIIKNRYSEDYGLVKNKDHLYKLLQNVEDQQEYYR